ncbi:MAG: hypothetical protein J0H68_01680 [Sphingobacteriia bacterium]|nr:hypothetical protein [Sphingobacteriia bacterium]
MALVKSLVNEKGFLIYSNNEIVCLCLNNETYTQCDEEILLNVFSKMTETEVEKFIKGNNYCSIKIAFEQGFDKLLNNIFAKITNKEEINLVEVVKKGFETACMRDFGSILKLTLQYYKDSKANEELVSVFKSREVLNRLFNYLPSESALNIVMEYLTDIDLIEIVDEHFKSDGKQIYNIIYRIAPEHLKRILNAMSLIKLEEIFSSTMYSSHKTYQFFFNIVFNHSHNISDIRPAEIITQRLSENLQRKIFVEGSHSFFSEMWSNPKVFVAICRSLKPNVWDKVFIHNNFELFENYLFDSFTNDEKVKVFEYILETRPLKEIEWLLFKNDNKCLEQCFHFKGYIDTLLRFSRKTYQNQPINQIKEKILEIVFHDPGFHKEVFDNLSLEEARKLIKSFYKLEEGIIDEESVFWSVLNLRKPPEKVLESIFSLTVYFDREIWQDMLKCTVIKELYLTGINQFDEKNEHLYKITKNLKALGLLDNVIGTQSFAKRFEELLEKSLPTNLVYKCPSINIKFGYILAYLPHEFRTQIIKNLTSLSENTIQQEILQKIVQAAEVFYDLIQVKKMDDLLAAKIMLLKTHYNIKSDLPAYKAFTLLNKSVFAFFHNSKAEENKEETSKFYENVIIPFYKELITQPGFDEKSYDLTLKNEEVKEVLKEMTWQEITKRSKEKTFYQNREAIEEENIIQVNNVLSKSK